MAAENPYAPPQSAVLLAPPVAPRSFGWDVVGKSVFVEPAAQFPRVDPFSGRSDDSMTPMEVKVRYRPWWLRVFPVVGAVIALYLNMENDPINLVVFVLIGTVVGATLSDLAGRCFPACTFRLFYEQGTLRKRRGLSFFGRVGGYLCILIFPHFVNWLPTSTYILAMLLIPSFESLKRKLRCIHKSGERYEIRGFSRKAVAALYREQEAGEGTFAEAASEC